MKTDDAAFVRMTTLSRSRPCHFRRYNSSRSSFDQRKTSLTALFLFYDPQNSPAIGDQAKHPEYNPRSVSRLLLVIARRLVQYGKRPFVLQKTSL
jgi:hypothetical protein